MKPLSESRVFAWLCIIGLVGVLTMVVSAAYATGTDIEQETDVRVGDTTVGGNDSLGLGFSHSLGDVDINQCMGSTAWGTILVSKQKLVLNKWCAGEVYDAKGLYRMGAIMRCSISDIRVHFPTDDACLAANEVSVPTPASAPPAYDEDEYEGDINALQARLDALESQRLKDAEAAQRAARRAQAAAKEVERAEADRKEYAQQVYEELKEWQ